MTEQTMRCFIGIPVDHQVALALLDVRDQALAVLKQAQVRPVLARNFHLTLAFLGELPARQRDQLAEGMSQVVSRHPAFLQPLTEAHLFPSPHGRLWVAEGVTVSVEMRRLREDLLAMLDSIGLAEQGAGGAMRPHITLLRGLVTPLSPPHFKLDLALPVRDLLLYESRPGPSGNDYGVLASAPLM